MLKFQKPEFQELFDEIYDNSEKDTDLFTLLRDDCKLLTFVQISSPDNLSYVKLNSLEYDLKTLKPEHFMYLLFMSIKDDQELYELFRQKTKVTIDVFVNNDDNV